jgi:hypothetical protein
MRAIVEHRPRPAHKVHRGMAYGHHRTKSACRRGRVALAPVLAEKKGLVHEHERSLCRKKTPRPGQPDLGVYSPTPMALLRLRRDRQCLSAAPRRKGITLYVRVHIEPWRMLTATGR